MLIPFCPHSLNHYHNPPSLPIYFPWHLPPCEARLICSFLLRVRGLQVLWFQMKLQCCVAHSEMVECDLSCSCSLGVPSFTERGGGSTDSMGCRWGQSGGWVMVRGGKKGICVVFNYMERKWKEKESYVWHSVHKKWYGKIEKDWNKES